MGKEDQVLKGVCVESVNDPNHSRDLYYPGNSDETTM